MSNIAKQKSGAATAGTAPPRFYLDGVPVTEIPPEAKQKMAERLSRVVSEYFSLHPDEYEAFLNARASKQKEPI